MKKIGFIFALVFLFSLFSCKKAETYCKIDLKDSIYWTQTDAFSNVYSVQDFGFKKFQKMTTDKSRSFEKLVGREGSYIWLKINFTIPENLRYRSLGLVIDYLHFSDKVWLNNVYIGGYGEFPPEEKSSLFVSHCYFFPDNLIKQTEENTILIKVWVHGKGDISDNIFIANYDDAFRESDRTTFINSRMYFIFAGCMLCAFILYFLMYIWRRKDKDHLSFALLNLASVVFLIPFFAPELPFYNSKVIDYLLFIKITLCISFCFLITFVSVFIIRYIGEKISTKKNITMGCFLLLPTFACLIAPSYNALMKLTPFVLIFMLIQLSFGLKVFFVSLFGKDLRKRWGAVVLLIGFSPVLISMVVDLILRGILKNTANPYISIFGWQFTIFTFIFMLTIRYNYVYKQNERLTTNLKTEVEKRTFDLKVANDKLEFEMKRNNIDLEMASIVQKKFFHAPTTLFRGWDIAITYNAATKVSGDLYDYYNTDENLDGIALFDVSGHGISASLITMLSKNIIFRAFRDAIKKRKSISKALYRINEEIIREKGDIENYLTGILLHFINFDENDVCQIEMANAGHPHPILYSAKKGESFEVFNPVEKPFGAVGIKDIAVYFPEINFSMEKDDVFVCFTDGLTESMNEKREQFGKERLIEILNNSGPKDAQSILEDIIDGLLEFSNGVPRDDDLTIIVLKRKNSNDIVEEFLEEI